MAAWRSLNKKQEFHEVYARGAKHVGRLAVVYLLPADDMARAVVASRKIGSAVHRNRSKRLLREAFRATFGTDPDQNDHVVGLLKRLLRDSGSETGDPSAAKGLWVVLVARRSILGASFRDVREELDHLLGH